MARPIRIRKLRRNLSLTGAIVTISVGVLVPVLLSTGVGIVALAIGEGSADLVLGVLVLSFAAAAIGSAIIATVLLGRRARIARLQSDLLANVTHELRTPLSAIRLHAQTLEQDIEDPEKAKRCVQIIIRETGWLEAMIDRVLTWRAAAKDRSAPEIVREPVGDVVEETAERFRRMFDPGEVDLAVDVATSTPVDHDKRSLGSAILNLLVNAYKYTGEDKKITLGARDGEAEVVITVEDNGQGIPKRELGRIFDPFHRADSRLGSKSAGAGLGLAIVRHEVRTHRGKVFVESEEGKGSTFSIHLPVVKEKRGG